MGEKKRNKRSNAPVFSYREQDLPKEKSFLYWR